MLTFRDTEKKFLLQGDLLKKITNRNYNVDHANLLDKKTMYEFAREIYFDVKSPGNKSPKDRSSIILFKSLVIMASGISTKLLLSDPNGLCDRSKLLLQEKHSGLNSNKIDVKIIATADEVLENKCISTK